MKKLLRLLLVGSIIAIVLHLITHRRTEHLLAWEDVLSSVPVPGSEESEAWVPVEPE